MSIASSLTMSEYRRQRRKQNPLKVKIYATRTALRWLGWSEEQIDAAIVKRLEELGADKDEGRRKRWNG